MPNDTPTPDVLNLVTEVSKLVIERDAARANARELAHAYTTDNRPRRKVVDESLAYPVIPDALTLATSKRVARKG
jgi:hypothetical protein